MIMSNVLMKKLPLTEEASWEINSTQFNKGVWHGIFNKWKKLLAGDTHNIFEKYFYRN